MVVLIDNYDSFVFNLARYLEELGERTEVVRNDAISVDEIRALRPRALLLSPGPCDPTRAGICVAAVEELAGEIPILGVCLGHQAIAAAFGGRIVRGEPVHGESSLVDHDGRGIFSGLPSPLRGGRYHSLVVDPDSLPAELEVTAWLRDGTVMAIRHRKLPIVGIQFHPESVLTNHGHELLANFLREHTGGRSLVAEPRAFSIDGVPRP